MTSGKVKIISLATALVISALALGYTLLVFKSDLSIGPGIWLFIALVIFMALFTFQSLLVQRSYLVSGLCLLEAVALLVPFYQSFSWILAGAGVATFFLFWSTSHLGRKDLANVLKIDFIKTAGQVSGRVSVAIVLVGVVSYVSALSFNDVSELVLSSTDVATEQIVAQFVQGALAGNVISQAREMILNQLNLIPDVFKRLIIVLFGVLLFFGIKGVMFIVNWLAALLAWVVYKVFVASGFISIVTEEATKEKIVL